MKFLTYTQNGVDYPGFLSADETKIFKLNGYSSLTDFIEQSFCKQLVFDSSKFTDSINISEVKLAAPIPHPKHDLWCIGQNYLEHALESARFKGVEYKKPRYPMYFGKRVDRAVANEEAIPSHADITSQLDYENELAVIIGKDCSNISADCAFDYIFGYTIANDVSARDIQNNHVQFALGKGLDGFAPMGPWIVTADEIQAPPALNIKTRVNGELRQNSNTSDFIFDIPYIISQISKGITLRAGDIILTGTPCGVGMGFNPPKFLKSGDIVECEIEKIGVLKNIIK